MLFQKFNTVTEKTTVHGALTVLTNVVPFAEKM